MKIKVIGSYINDDNGRLQCDWYFVDFRGSCLAFFSMWLTSLITRKIESDTLHFWISIFLFTGLLVLPLADELIGRAQFKALCEKSQKISINREKARDRIITNKDPVNGKIKVNNLLVGNAVIPITESEFFWFDVKTGELLISYKAINARGGWLIRSLRISENDSPLLFNGASCRPSISKIFSELNIKEAN